jgi:hypothetical protein
MPSGCTRMGLAVAHAFGRWCPQGPAWIYHRVPWGKICSDYELYWAVQTRSLAIVRELDQAPRGCLA